MSRIPIKTPREQDEELKKRRLEQVKENFRNYLSLKIYEKFVSEFQAKLYIMANELDNIGEGASAASLRELVTSERERLYREILLLDETCEYCDIPKSSPNFAYHFCNPKHAGKPRA